jgi:hypothetical protein
MATAEDEQSPLRKAFFMDNEHIAVWEMTMFSETARKLVRTACKQ